MGMASAFQPGVADFSGITGDRDLSISAVVQKNFIKVDEDGTEAAAATAAGMGMRTAVIAPAPTVVFNADHPFFYEIREVRTGVSLFMGSIVRPRLDPGWIGGILPGQQRHDGGALGE